ncbi:MAG: hypothetical protein ACE5FA_01860 [Dehalococcoidia bacterium]
MATLTAQPRFGSFDLAAANGITIESWSETAPNKAELHPRLYGDGSIHARTRREGRRIRLRGAVYGTDEGDRRDKEDALTQALVNGQQLLRLWSDRAILCRLERDLKWQVAAPRLLARRWEAVMRSEWESWEGALVTDGPWNYSSATQKRTLPAHSGTAPTYPTILLDNQGAAFTASLLITTMAGRQLSLQGFSMNNLQTLLIDMQRGRLGDGTSSAPRIASLEGEFWAIDASTTATLELASDISTPNIDVTVQFNHRYWSGS